MLFRGNDDGISKYLISLKKNDVGFLMRLSLKKTKYIKYKKNN
jgi:hypothetical protein